MDGISNGIRAVEIMLRSGFFMVLAVTAFQDCRERRIRVSVFVIFGTAGIVLRGVELFLEINALSGDWESVDLWGFAARRILDVGAAMAVGGGMLLWSAMTRGAIGRGDGLFFSVSGLYLGFFRNFILLMGGLTCCFLVCGILVIKGVCAGQNVRRRSVPFLPFLVPGGIGVMFL